MEDIMTMHDLAAVASARDQMVSTHAHSNSDSTPSTTAETQSLRQNSNINRSQSLSHPHSHLRQHARSASVATSSPRTRKRLSLSFPVLPPNHTPASRLHSPITPSPVHSPIPDVSQVTPEDSTTFLTALAAQERRVLELREELGKAETELGKLKKQWALHEATKKRHELTLNTAALRGESGVARDRLTSPISRESQQLRRLATIGTAGTSNRKVLPSQRHQRTLSLLSPDRLQHSQPSPQQTEVKTSEEPLPNEPAPAPAPALVKRHTIPAQSGPSNPASAPTTAAQPDQSHFEFPSKRNSQDVLLRTSKQFAEDFKDGLWTFLEDLRQATVGEDTPRTTSSQSLRRVSSRASMRSNASVGRSSGAAMQRALSKDNLSRETLREPKKKQKEEESLIDFGDDAASSEGERDPSFRWSTSTTLSDIPTGASTPPSRASTPRTSTSSTISNPIILKSELDDHDDRTPQSPLWDTMVSSTSAAFTRLRLDKTATALMNHVERNIIGPTEPRSGYGSGYRGVEHEGQLRSRTASPVKADFGKRD